MAVLIDHLLQSVVVVAVVLLGIGAISAFHLSGTWAAAGMIIALFCVFWGYFTFFEIFWKGQSPGKKLLKIRVIKNNGRSITFYESLARNLVRLVDSMPTAYGIGLLAMFIDSKNRRLGDLVAGTLVVHERAQQEPNITFENFAVAEASIGNFDVSRLTAEDLLMIERFLARRLDIDYSARLATGEKLASLIRGKLKLEPTDGVSDEDFLEHVARTLRDTAPFRN